MLPNNSEAWVFILVSCVIGFVMGQWLKTRKSKATKNDEYINSFKRMALADTRGRIKKDRKKNRRTHKQNGG